MTKNPHYIVIMGLAAFLVAVKGAGAGDMVRGEAGASIEESAVFTVTLESPPSQLMDLNMISVMWTGTHDVPKLLTTSQSTYLIPKTPVLATIFEEEERTEITEYEVQPGDVLSGVASDFGVTMQTIISANKISNVDSIKPGTILKIPPVSGVVHIVKKGDTVGSLAKKYGAEQEKIISFNGLPLAGDLQVGDEIIVPGGTLPKVAPVRAITGSKRFAGLPAFEGFFKTPADCRITQKGHGRNGIDCAGAVGTPIYAVASGLVEISDPSGYNGGFGKYVQIEHGNGTETLYAHMSRVVVEAKETVSQGQLIGYMGNTGRSTGPHLHFECHGCLNPLSGYKLGATVRAKQ